MVCEFFTDCPYESFREPCQIPECDQYKGKTMTDTTYPQDLIDEAQLQRNLARYLRHLSCSYEEPDWMQLAGAAIEQVRNALASGSVAAVDVAPWVTHVEVELQGHDPAWPNGTRMQEGMGATVAEALAAAIADATASKGGQ